MDLLYIAVGGTLGAITRYLMSKALPNLPLPWGTLVVNAVGSFILSFVLYSSFFAGLFTRAQRLLIATGFCGSLTTFSTFAYEAFALYSDGGLILSIANVLMNLVAGLLAIWLGRALAVTLARTA